MRLLAYTNYANMGIYRDAVAQFVDHSSPEPETVPEITNHPWHITRKYGFGINVEQGLTRNLHEVDTASLLRRNSGAVMYAIAR